MGSFDGKPHACYIGIERGTPAKNSVWQGECLGCLASPPSLQPQIFHNLSMGSRPVWRYDLASDTNWTLSSPCLNAPRPVVVPGGGFNSDLQRKPWIDGYLLQKTCAETQNMTYKRSFDLPADKLLAGRAVFIEFGGVAHGAEVEYG